MRVRDLVQMLKDNGWVMVRVRGNHHHFRYPSKHGPITVPGNPNLDLQPGTCASVLKYAGLKG